MSESNSGRPSITSEEKAKTIETNGREYIWSVAFLDDGKHVVAGTRGYSRRETPFSGKFVGNIRLWRVADAEEVATVPMSNEWQLVHGIATSRDGRWIVIGVGQFSVWVWNAENDEKPEVTKFKVTTTAKGGPASKLDVSPDGSLIVTGLGKTVCFWSFSGQQLLSLEHGRSVNAVRFSPDGRLVATGTWGSVRVYDAQNGNLLVDDPLGVRNANSLAWASGSKHLFVLSGTFSDAFVHCLDISTGKTLSKWSVPGNDNNNHIALASNDAYIALSSGPFVSFWDTMTCRSFGPLIQHIADVRCIAMSYKHDLVTCVGRRMILWNLRDILPSPYCDDVIPVQRIPCATKAFRILDDSSKKIASLEKAIQELRHALAEFDLAAKKKEIDLSNTIDSLSAQDTSSKKRIAVLEKTLRALHRERDSIQLAANGQVESFNESIESLCMRNETLDSKVADLEESNRQLAESHQKANNLIRVHEQKHHCEALYTEGCIVEATRSLVEIKNTMSEDVKTNKLIMDWLADFTKRCLSALEASGDEALGAEKHDEALSAYFTALLLGPPTSTALLIKWVSVMLISGSANVTLDAADKFNFPKLLIYQTICDIFERDGRITEGIKYFRQMQSEQSDDPSIHAAWEVDFRHRSVEKLVNLGDTEMSSQNYDVAIGYYSDALTLDPINLGDILFRRSTTLARMGSWERVLIDADKLIELDPTSYKGYERKHAALHGMKRYSEAFEVFEMMLSNIERSPDPHVRDLRSQYVDATPAIRKTIEHTLRDVPRVLIDTTTGRLYDKTHQAKAFEELPIYDELRSSMITGLDRLRIRTAVETFYRYVMFSHRWEYGEPLFQRVERISVYDLEQSSPNIKLQTFCRLIEALGYHWVWSDTCCIDRKDNVVLQESLVAMFTWYRGSALTIVYLRGIWSHSQQPGDLWRSEWNTRAWTYQEYVAAKTVQFYTEDWKPYLGLQMFNHKESPAIITEMQQAAGAFTEELAVLKPGPDRVREKLYLASTRQTTLVEDIAYSLLGIFNAAIPAIYGEGNRAVGRLLEHVLAGSGDLTILAWTGRAGGYNSCLPPDLTVYDHLVPPHVPQPMKNDEMEHIVSALRSSLPDLSLAVALYDHLNKLPSPFFTAARLSLPCIAFPITQLDTLEPKSETDTRIYHATTSALGEVEIKTTDNLSGTNDLLFVHPWIIPLLDQEFSHGVATRDCTTRALRLVARLRQPFGALLLEPVGRARYRRVAADCLIVVRVREGASLDVLVGDIRTVDIQ